MGALAAFAIVNRSSLGGARARWGTGYAASARQHNTVALGGGNLPGWKPVSFVRSVTEWFGRRAPTSAQHNDFRWFAVFPGRGDQFLPMGRNNPNGPLHD